MQTKISGKLPICLAAAAVLLALALLALPRKAAAPSNAPELLPELTVEAGMPMPEPAAFLSDLKDPTPEYLEILTAEQLHTPGSYTVGLSCGGWEYEAVIHVQDTQAPTAEAVSVTSRGERPEPEAFLINVMDATEVTASYVREPVLTEHGVQMVTLRLADTSENVTLLEAELTVDLDFAPPEIHGVEPVEVYQGDAVAYRAGITVTDDYDPAAVLTVDASQVDLSTPGEYTLLYIAKDASGNIGHVWTTVTVRQKQASYVSVETVYEEADKILDRILTEGMTKREQARAVFDWVQKVARYVNHAEKTDDLQGAYQMFTEHIGDCFHYFAACKVLLQRLGIDTIDVRKVKNSPEDTDHYWLLVSLDGENYYHFDSVPRLDREEGFFLVTDKELDEYSRNYANCFNRDRSLYPATPES